MKKVGPTAMISRVLSQTLRISAFLSCIRSIRYAGASAKLLLRRKTFVSPSQPWVLQSANFTKKQKQEFFISCSKKAFFKCWCFIIPELARDVTSYFYFS